MPGCGHVGVIHRLIGLHFTQNADAAVVVEKHINRFKNALRRSDGALGFANVGSFACQPQNNVFGLHHLSEVHGAA